MVCKKKETENRTNLQNCRRKTKLTQMILGFLHESFAIAGEDPSHICIAISRDLIVEAGLSDLQARPVHTLTQDEILRLLLHHVCWIVAGAVSGCRTVLRLASGLSSGSSSAAAGDRARFFEKPISAPTVTASTLPPMMLPARTPKLESFRQMWAAGSSGIGFGSASAWRCK